MGNGPAINDLVSKALGSSSGDSSEHEAPRDEVGGKRGPSGTDGHDGYKDKTLKKVPKKSEPVKSKPPKKDPPKKDPPKKDPPKAPPAKPKDPVKQPPVKKKY